MLVFKTALIIGGSTILGGFAGLFLKNASKKIIDALLAVSYGIMLTVAVTGMIEPCIDYNYKTSFFTVAVCVFAGAISIHLSERCLPKFQRMLGVNESSADIKKSLLLIFAIIIHNLPEGTASGMGILMEGNVGLYIMIGIAVQNVPEGIMVMLCMLKVDKNVKKALSMTVITAFCETVGVLSGYYMAELFSYLLNAFLSFAGGAMLYAVTKETVFPDAEGRVGYVYLLMAGFIFMIGVDCFLN
ncbi:MAG: ZIP family metal transporter [Christensenellaceae bacterium]